MMPPKIHFALLCAAALGALVVQRAPAAPLADVVEGAQPKIAKLYGAGGLRGLEAYQSGVVISPSGHILTVWSYVLDADSITVVLNDGRRFEAELAGADPRLEIAVLKPREELDEIPYFDLEQAQAAGGGTRIVAFSNCFGVAAGDEAASVQTGTVMAVTPLNAHRGVFKATYRGPVYVLDAVTSNPGAAGGAITDDDGRLVGLIGRELRNSANGTWLNYALPMEELRASMTRIQAGELATAQPLAQDSVGAANPTKLSALGIVLVPDILNRTPAYVDAIVAGSPAAKAGLKPDDLFVTIGGRLVQSRGLLEEELKRWEADKPLKVTVLRGDDELLEVELTPTP
jgi:S1-C subfamily serine protease